MKDNCTVRTGSGLVLWFGELFEVGYKLPPRRAAVFVFRQSEPKTINNRSILVRLTRP